MFEMPFFQEVVDFRLKKMLSFEIQDIFITFAPPKADMA